ncbi:MAG: tetratricopeptide repeat protein [Propionivibrio sp.]|uniref:tetratricopeptide repeat protein n=1 Tax=Propionivibrio sp. TaxID=2212460 RepID=UPI001B767315|nr:tetratricopeptide repeat protein [Propionivibrio sp.]MBP7203440.1 tetratricopeptide repeat protein [Propionivibrio sp.]
MKYFRSTLLFAALAALFSQQALAADEVTPAKKRPPAKEAKRPVTNNPKSASEQLLDQSGQQVFQVLVAEMALQYGDTSLATKAYSDLSLRTRDPRVLERTVEIAGYARRFDIALEAAKLWLDVEPDSVRAQQMLTSMLIMSNRMDELAPTLIRMLEMDRAALGANLLGLNRMFARNEDRVAVFNLIEKVCRPFFGVAEAHYAVAIAANSAAMHERAQAEANRALELRPEWEMAALLQAQIAARTSTAQAITYLQAFVDRNPMARDVHLQLARALVGEKRYDEARQHFNQLLKGFPNNPDVVYPVALLALQQNDLVVAETQFNRLLTLDIPDKSIAYYYLAQIAEEKGKLDEALGLYAKVESGDQMVQARMRSAQILAGQGKLDEARKLLSEASTGSEEQSIQFAIAEAALLRKAKQPQAAFDLLDARLEQQPDNAELLYETALLAERLDQLEIMERRLRRLIELQPGYAQAYNALGYSFAERGIRLPEARELIDKALTLLPNDTFILDSLGWVLYRQGDLSGALATLERAYGMRDDPEIGAHLGEVLWALGRKDDAQKLLRAAQKKHPDNEPLADAVKKFAD